MRNQNYVVAFVVCFALVACSRESRGLGRIAPAAGDEQVSGEDTGRSVGGTEHLGQPVGEGPLARERAGQLTSDAGPRITEPVLDAVDASTCAVAGAICSSRVACCADLLCDPHSNTCLVPRASCLGIRSACVADADCCSPYTCEAGQCSSVGPELPPIGCASDSDCPASFVCNTSTQSCSGPLTCRTYLDSCDFSSDCCPGYECDVDDDYCASVDSCHPISSPCIGDRDCCEGLLCDLDGHCNTERRPTCAHYCDVCDSDSDCCSGACDPASGLCL